MCQLRLFNQVWMPWCRNCAILWLWGNHEQTFQPTSFTRNLNEQGTRTALSEVSGSPVELEHVEILLTRKSKRHRALLYPSLTPPRAPFHVIRDRIAGCPRVAGPAKSPPHRRQRCWEQREGCDYTNHLLVHSRSKPAPQLLTRPHPPIAKELNKRSANIWTSSQGLLQTSNDY